VRSLADSERVVLPDRPLVFGADIEREAVEATLANLHAAGFGKCKQVQVSEGDVAVYEPPVKPDLIICNPPYGLRLSSSADLPRLYASIGDFMKNQSSASDKARGFVVAGEARLAKLVGLRSTKRHLIEHGGLDARFLEYKLYR